MARRHDVQVHSDHLHFAERVVAFVAPVAEGGSMVAIARPDTLAEIEHGLRSRGSDVDALRAAGQLELLDAESTLARFMVGGVPDRERFRACVGTLIAGLAKPVRAYSEMVDLLWVAGHHDAGLRLEELWSELATEHPFDLLCGYPRSGVAGEPYTRSFEAIGVHVDHVEATDDRTKLERRMQLLLDLSTELAGLHTRTEVARIAVDKGRAAVDACEVALWELSPDRSRLELLAMSTRREGAQLYVDVALDGDTPLAHAVRANEPVFLRSLAEYRERFPASAARIAAAFPYPEAAFAVLPIAADDKPVGGLVLIYDHRREFTPADRAFKAILARQCEYAFARLHAIAHERQLRADAELLYGVIDAVNRTEDLEQVCEIALRAVERGSGSPRSAILLFDRDGVMRFEASHGLSEQYRAAVEGHSPWNRETRDPTPIAIDDTEADPAWEHYRPVFRAEGIRALAFVPLVHQGRLLGKLMLYRGEPREFSSRDLQLVWTIAVHVAQAVERHRAAEELARAYREERAAHLEAEEATRAREEILSVVSHDLRNPLGTILMGASTLLHVELGDRTQRVRTTAERIHRQAERMARLIEDLVDFAGLQAGRVAIQRAEHAPREIIAATSDIFAPLARERGLTFEACTPDGLPHVHCDPDRAVQVMSNLVANALKVTPKGGLVQIGAQPNDRDVVFFVKDTGPGIDPDELPSLFERYWRSKKPSYKGAGLGLSIARGIVDAHGGRIWAESQVGVGATFYFSLSALRNN